MKNKICGHCSHFYCEKCVKTNKKVDMLDEKCDLFMDFNPDEYRSNKKGSVINDSP